MSVLAATRDTDQPQKTGTEQPDRGRYRYCYLVKVDVVVKDTRAVIHSGGGAKAECQNRSDHAFIY